MGVLEGGANPLDMQLQLLMLPATIEKILGVIRGLAP